MNDDGKRMDHVLFSSVLAKCEKQFDHCYDVTDDSFENYIQFMKPRLNGNISSIESESNLLQVSMSHDTYFLKEIFDVKKFTISDLIENLQIFIEIESITECPISKNKEHLKYFMDRGLS